MKYLVVTGAHGYIGSALTNHLASDGRALQLVSYFSPIRPTRGSELVKHVQADLRNEANWRPLLEDADGILHLSWRTDLRAAEADPNEDRELNVEPVRALIRAAKNLGRPLPMIFASTVTIAGHAPAIPASEQTPDRPSTTYDRHKLECERMLRDATRERLLHACSLRLANVYGYGSGVQSTNANRGILNEIMRRAVQGEPLTLYGGGKYVRDFIFIGDVVDAFCRALNSNQVLSGDHYVVASGRGYTLAEAFELVAEEASHRVGRPVEIRRVPEPPDLYPIEQRNFVGDSSLLQTLTGWRPQVDLRNGIRDYFNRSLTAYDPPAPRTRQHS
jgi:UDP-glucose 4-epimerase